MAAQVSFERKVFKDHIRDAIYEAIISGELKPGDRIAEMDWAARFSTSQAPVREALRELESRGAVVSIPFKGSFVREMTSDEISDILLIRTELEALAMAKAAERAEEDDVLALKRLLDEMTLAATAKNEELFMEKDIEFHEFIVTMAKIPDLVRMWNMCNIKLWTAVITRDSRSELIAIANLHKPLYDCIMARDSVNAAKITKKHFEDVRHI